jgi:hypothetical protein
MPINTSPLVSGGRAEPKAFDTAAVTRRARSGSRDRPRRADHLIHEPSGAREQQEAA